ncbi:uncharacterized protein LOC115758936 [Drosophila novamexicana]|uniref:uncharacterized protein LOC115758936 n=1 Tax=Drosophila novamexicana TaxID=47314 RepID=UPI0011E5E3AB|nr:uncharacterized protein LOC115758936 [Drosophila novamexicana]
MTTIVLRAMREDDIDEATLFLRDHFYGHEPLMQTPGDHQVIFDDPKRREYRLSLIRQGTSLVALEGDRFVGVAFAGVLQPSDLEQNWLEVNEQKPKNLIEHTHYFLSDIERRAHWFEHYGSLDTLYLNILAVDASVRRQGLGRRLVTALMEVGRAKGLPLLVATCTSLYSARVMAALGMECVLSEAYANYKDEHGNVVIQPPEPHIEARVMAIKL